MSGIKDAIMRMVRNTPMTWQEISALLRDIAADIEREAQEDAEAWA